jgi:nitrite reductase/ring-hydroxylating ferredoxin subunit
MPEHDEERAAERLDRLVSDLLAGKHLKATPSDAEEQEAIRAAAQLAGSREGYPRMSSSFRGRLRGLLEKGEPAPWMNRRAALVGGVGLTAGALAGVLGGQLGQLGQILQPARQQEVEQTGKTVAPTPPFPRSVIDPRPELGRWIDTGILFTEMVEGAPRRVTAGSVGAFVFRKGDQVLAMSAYCTHLPCELVWKSSSHQLNCPCHNQLFDTDGLALGEGYKLPALPLVRTRVNNGRVEILGTA